MNSEILPLYFALPLFSLAAAALAVHLTLKLRAADVRIRTQTRHPVLEPGASEHIPTPG